MIAMAIALSVQLPDSLPAGEQCDNALDDDGDGLIDLNDPDCDCPVIEPISRIPNPSFEDMNCCPDSRSQLHCADTWIQASEATTDYLHTCGWMGWPDLPPPLPFPDGEAVVGFRNGRGAFMDEGNPNWKEYAGACLLAPLRARNSYRFQFNIGFTNPINSPPTTVVFFGTTDCNNLPFGEGNERFGCPTNGEGWIRLGAVNVSGANNWITTSIDITPEEDIYAIAIGPDCRELSNIQDDIYYFFDNLVLAEQRDFEFKITSTGHPCADDFTLQVPEEDSLSYQWYRDGIALIGETRPQLLVKKSPGAYVARIIGPGECRITRQYSYRAPQIVTETTEIICPGESYPFQNRFLEAAGSYLDTLKSVDNCDSIVYLELQVASEFADTVEARIFEGEKYAVGPYRYYRQGSYLANLQSQQGCDSLVYLDLSFYQVYFPTAFSPDGDGVNDRFTVFGGTDLQGISSLRIFDRWGNEVYSGTDLVPNDATGGWDGQYRGQAAPNGVYVYLATLRMVDEKERNLSGSLVLMR